MPQPKDLDFTAQTDDERRAARLQDAAIGFELAAGRPTCQVVGTTSRGTRVCGCQLFTRPDGTRACNRGHDQEGTP
jgi:hypothetical protein